MNKALLVYALAVGQRAARLSASTLPVIIIYRGAGAFMAINCHPVLGS